MSYINELLTVFHRYWRIGPGTSILLLLVIGLVLAPLAALVWIAFGDAGDVWPHLISTVLPRSIWTTIKLMLGVGSITLVIGVVTAWLVTMCRFPGKAIFEWALLLPLAMPTYIVAYASVEIFDYTGPAQTFVRWVLDAKTSRDYWFPEIRSLPGAIVVMSLVLYPYVYLTTRASFLLQSACALDVSRTLGAGPLRLFFSVAIPLARPAIAVGVTLALMECLNDIGAVEFYGVRTLTFSVYDTWLNRSSLAGAAQIACVMLLVVFGLIWIERAGRKNQRFHVTSKRYHALPGYWLAGWRKWLAFFGCLLPVALGFLMPSLVLVRSSILRYGDNFGPDFWSAMLNSFLLASFAAVLTAMLGVWLAYIERNNGAAIVKLATRIGAIGYAVPGTILAVGVLIPMAHLDGYINSTMKALFGISTGLLMLGSGAALVYAYVIRFLTVSYGAGESGLGRVSVNLDAAARTLGRTSFQTLCEIDLPMIRPALISGALLVFVDVMKELPVTILLRPFNFDTLATLVYTQASLESFENASFAALSIVAVGIVPVILLARTSTRSVRS